MVSKVHDSFGRLMFTSGTSSGDRIGFTGREYEADLGIYYYRARFYDPNIGRFISRDPLGFMAGDVNLYRYVGNNPVLFRDPFGLVTLKKGVTDETLKPVLKDKYDLIDEIYKKHNAPEAVITSTNKDSNIHRKGSKHYSDEAIDLRGNNVSDKKMRELARALQEALGDDYDVIPEFYPDNPARDHIHIEYDPKQKTEKKDDIDKTKCGEQEAIR